MGSGTVRKGNPLREKPMKKMIFTVLLLAASPVLSPALAQSPTAPKRAAAHVDNCAPIGRTANGTLVYSMKCETLPAPPVAAAPAPAQAQAAPEAPAEEPEVQRTGIFGLSYTRKRPDQ
jgi:hypothetical protein